METRKAAGRFAVGLALLALAACSLDPGRTGHGVSGPAAAPPPPPGSYVALGDSFTAAPFVPRTVLAGGCFRSDGNYPALVADRLAVPRFVDVSCSGADTGDLVRPQRTFGGTVPPQLHAVGRETDLVTSGIGGNDFGLFGTLVGRCTRLRTVDPLGSPCTDALAREGVDLVALTERIGRRVARVVRLVRKRAPDALVLVVGYPRLAPRQGYCPELGLARGDVVTGDRVTRALNRALARAARAGGAGFVDMYAASAGHDICASEPWVNGRVTDRAAALAFHPFPAGMDAVADRIVARFR